MNNSSVSVEYLSLFTCFIIDIPSQGRDCSQANDSICIECLPTITAEWFFTGEAIADKDGRGHVICFWIWVMIILVGTVGIIGNLLIIFILREIKLGGRRTKFDYLLTALAVFDLFYCVVGMLAATGEFANFMGWGTRGGFALTYFYFGSNLASFFARSFTTHMTVYITIHCYLGLAYPLQARKWFTWYRIKMLPVFVITISIVFNIPRAGLTYVDKNLYSEIPSLHGLEYIMYVRESWSRFWYETMFGIHEQLDYFLPMPILFLLNILSYGKMKSLQNARQELTCGCANEKKLHLARMFLPVVSFLLLFNSGPVIWFIFSYWNRVIHRELTLAAILSHTMNSSVNFLVYNIRGNDFRKSTKRLSSRFLMHRSRKP